MRRSTFPMIAVGVLAAQGCADQEPVEPLSTRNSGFFLVRRASDACLPSSGGTCGAYVVSAINSTSTRCADGSFAPACEVASIDVSGLGLPAAQSDALIASISPSLTSPEVVLRGHL